MKQIKRVLSFIIFIVTYGTIDIGQHDERLTMDIYNGNPPDGEPGGEGI